MVGIMVGIGCSEMSASMCPLAFLTKQVVVFDGAEHTDAVVL